MWRLFRSSSLSADGKLNRDVSGCQRCVSECLNLSQSCHQSVTNMSRFVTEMSPIGHKNLSRDVTEMSRPVTAVTLSQAVPQAAPPADRTLYGDRSRWLPVRAKEAKACQHGLTKRVARVEQLKGDPPLLADVFTALAPCDRWG